MPFWSVNCNIYIPADSLPSHGSAKNLHNSSVFWLNMVSWKMLRFAWGCNPCSVSVLETSRIDSASFSFVSIHSFARTWPVFTSKDSEPSSQGHRCWLRMLSNPTPPHPHVDTKQVSGVASQWRSKCNVRYYPTPPHPHVVTKQVSGVASQWRSKCNVRYYPTPPHPMPTPNHGPANSPLAYTSRRKRYRVKRYRRAKMIKNTTSSQRGASFCIQNLSKKSSVYFGSDKPSITSASKRATATFSHIEDHRA